MSNQSNQTPSRTTVTDELAAAWSRFSIDDIRTAMDRCWRAGTPGPEVAEKLRGVLDAMLRGEPVKDGAQ